MGGVNTDAKGGTRPPTLSPPPVAEEAQQHLSPRNPEIGGEEEKAEEHVPRWSSDHVDLSTPIPSSFGKSGEKVDFSSPDLGTPVPSAFGQGKAREGVVPAFSLGGDADGDKGFSFSTKVDDMQRSVSTNMGAGVKWGGEEVGGSAEEGKGWFAEGESG
eukprot:799856-Amorphochlora_amoeboformis.AAC.1